jgi:hypothetical protein
MTDDTDEKMVQRLRRQKCRQKLRLTHADKSCEWWLESFKEYFELRGRELYKRKDGSNGAKAGDKAGCIGNRGYLRVKLHERGFYVHRIIYQLFHNKAIDDKAIIDHIDGNRLNNDPSNLREVTRSQNGRNRSGAQANSQTGVLGVSPRSGGKFEARIRGNGKMVCLGCFATEAEAKRTRAAAAFEFFGVHASKTEFIGIDVNAPDFIRLRRSLMMKLLYRSSKKLFRLREAYDIERTPELELAIRLETAYHAEIIKTPSIQAILTIPSQPMPPPSQKSAQLEFAF